MSDGVVKRILESLPENNRLERIWKLGKIEFKKRYYDNFLGLFWALLNPIIQLIIYYSVFTFILDRGKENFALYLFLGFIFWMPFTDGTNKSFSILRSKKYLIENIQFNWYDLFYAAILSVMIGFVFNLSAYFLISSLLGVGISYQVIWLPVIVINLCILLLGASLILSSLSIFIRDLAMVWSFVLMAGFWSTPILFDDVMLFTKAPFLKYATPMAGIIVNARKVTLYSESPDIQLMIYDFGYALVLLFLGIILFKRLSNYATEKL